MEWLYLGAGLVIGSLASWLVLRARAQERMATLRVAAAKLEEELRAERDKATSFDAIQERMRETFTALAHQALTSNSEQLLSRSRDQLAALLQQVRGDWGTHKQELKGLVDPLNKALETMDQQVRTLEQKREGAYQSLGEQLRNLGDAQTQLRQSTVRLEQSLKSSTARGRWGELQLRRVVEMAGMTKHVDFQEQVSAEGGRPDMIVRLPNGGILPIDAKAPAAAYLDAMNLEGEARIQKLIEHAKAMRSRVILRRFIPAENRVKTVVMVTASTERATRTSTRVNPWHPAPIPLCPVLNRGLIVSPPPERTNAPAEWH